MARNNGKVTIRRTPNEAGDLVGPGEVAEILGVEPTRVPRYYREGKLPEPVATVGNGKRRIWLRSEVMAMARRRAKAKAKRQQERAKA